MTRSYVIKALRLLDLEEILKLSQIASVKPTLMKKASGEDLIVWGEDFPDRPVHEEIHEEKAGIVLPFKKNAPDFHETAEPDQSQTTSAASNPIDSSDFMFWNRDLTKDMSSPVLKKEAVREYARSTEMYIVKTATQDGKEKIRFAATNGVLVNKKQA